MFRVLRTALTSFHRQGYAYIWANFLFVLLALPVVTAPGAWAALFAVAHATQSRPYEEAGFDVFLAHFRDLWRKALPWGALMTLIGAVNLFNLITYWGAPGWGYALLRAAYTFVALVWAGVLLYTWPLYFELEQPNVWTATRNALVMLARNPLFTLALLLVVALVLGLSAVLVGAPLLITFGALAALGTAAVLNRLALIRTAAQPN